MSSLTIGLRFCGMELLDRFQHESTGCRVTYSEIKHSLDLLTFGKDCRTHHQEGDDDAGQDGMTDRVAEHGQPPEHQEYPGQGARHGREHGDRDESGRDRGAGERGLLRAPRYGSRGSMGPRGAGGGRRYRRRVERRPRAGGRRPAAPARGRAAPGRSASPRARRETRRGAARQGRAGRPPAPRSPPSGRGACNWGLRSAGNRSPDGRAVPRSTRRPARSAPSPWPAGP